MARRLALIIGNSVYRDSTLARLMTPDVDVGALAEILLDPELGAFEDANVLINMTSATVRRAISDFFAKKTREDLLLLYFSGHGVLDESGRLHLAVKDTDHNLLRGTAISASFITDEMDNSRSQRQVLILDCCHSGAFARGAKGAPGLTVGTASAFEGTGFGRVVLTATDATQYAWEGDRIIGEAESSLFTHYIVQGLQSGAADINQDGQVTIDELYDYVYGEVVRQTPQQTPGKWSYKEQGEIVIAQAAQRQKPLPIVEKKPQVDEEQEQRLDQLYTRGLSAYWLEDWDRATRSFQAIAEIQPDYRDAAAKLAEARRQLDLKEHYEKALTALQAGAFQEAITALEAVVSATPDYKDAATQLEIARKRRQIADLYAQARQLAQAGQWQAIINVFDRMAALDPDYADPEELLSTAQREFEVQKRHADIERQYRQALQAMNAGQWQQARQLFAQIQEAETGFEDTERLLARAETEIARQEALRRTQEQVGVLYEQAHSLARARQWRQALEKINQIQALDPQFPDPEGLATSLQTELSQEEQETQRRNELATKYAEAVRLLNAGEYQAALEKWEAVRLSDPHYPDRQKVQSIARKKLTTPTHKVILEIFKSRWIPKILPILFGLIAFSYLGNSLPKGLSGFYGDNEAWKDRSACWAYGYAVDPDHPDVDVRVRILSDGMEVAQTVANVFREDWKNPRTCPGGTCGFEVDLWNLISHDIEHSILMQAQDIQTGEWINLDFSPKVLNCAALPEGFHDGNQGQVLQSDCVAFGWAVDPDNRDFDATVRILSDGVEIAQTVSSVPRQDLEVAGECPGGTCSFNVDLWNLISRNTEHSISVEAQDAQTNEWKYLEATPKNLTCVVGQLTVPGVWYHEDFQSGRADGWRLDLGWKVKPEEDGNYVLSGTGHRWALLVEAGQEWRDYLVRFRLKLLEGAIHLNYRLSEDPFTRYFIGFSMGELYLSRQRFDNFTELRKVPASYAPGVWHNVEINGQGGHIQVFVDGRLELDYTDSDPILQGTIAFETLGNSPAMIDDIEVTPAKP